MWDSTQERCQGQPQLGCQRIPTLLWKSPIESLVSLTERR